MRSCMMLKASTITVGMPGRPAAADELALERLLGAEDRAQATRALVRRRLRLQGRDPGPHMIVPRPKMSVLRLTAITSRAPSARARRHRHRIDQRAVDQPAAVERDRRENSGQGIGGAHRIDQTAARQPDFVAGADLGGDGGKADRQRLDRRVAEMLLQPCRELAAADQAAAGQADVEIARGCRAWSGCAPNPRARRAGRRHGSRRPPRRSRCRR